MDTRIDEIERRVDGLTKGMILIFAGVCIFALCDLLSQFQFFVIPGGFA